MADQAGRRRAASHHRCLRGVGNLGIQLAVGGRAGLSLQDQLEQAFQQGLPVVGDVFADGLVDLDVHFVHLA
jgi:hypothetical protein